MQSGDVVMNVNFVKNIKFPKEVDGLVEKKFKIVVQLIYKNYDLVDGISDKKIISIRIF